MATQEFAELGFYGARVDQIAARSSTTKRMIYHYFGDKDGLFRAVLEKAYADIRAVEASVDFDEFTPRAALARLVRITIEHHDRNPHLAKLVTAENLLDAVHLRSSEHQSDTNVAVVDLVGRLLARGFEAGEFAHTPDPLDLHLIMSGLALFRITNQASIHATFGRDLRDESERERYVQTVTAMILTWLGTT